MNTPWLIRLCDGVITGLLWVIAGLGLLIAGMAGQLPAVVVALGALLAGWLLGRAARRHS